MKTVTKILLGIGGILFAIDGIIKIVSPDFTFLGMTMPCGTSLILVGLGLAGLAFQK